MMYRDETGRTTKARNYREVTRAERNKTMSNEIKMGMVFFDEAQGCWLTVDGVGTNPNVFSCIKEEFDENGELVATGRLWMSKGDLLQMKKSLFRWWMSRYEEG